MPDQTIYETPRPAGRPGRDRGHQHLRPQLRRPLRRQRPRRRRPDRPHQHRPAQVDARAAAAARLRARLRPDRAREPPRPAAASAAAHRARAAAGSSSASPGTRRSTRSRARCSRVRDTYGTGGDPRLLAHRAASRCCTAARTVAAAPPHVRRLHGALVEHLGGGRGLRGAHDLRRQGRLQERRAASPPTTSTRELILMWGWSPGDGTFGTGTLQYLKLRQEAAACGSSAWTRAGRAPAGELADEHVFIQPVDRRRRADRHGLRDRQRGPARPGLSSTATCSASTRRTCRPGAPAGRLVPRVPPGRRATACAKTPEWAAADHRHAGRDASGGSRSSSPPPSRRRCTAATRRAAPRYGEQFHRAAYALCGDHRQRRHPRRQLGRQQRRHRPRRHQEPAAGANPTDARVASPLLADLLARGKAGGYPADIKMIYSVGGDLFNQCPNVNKMRGGRSSGVEFIVVHDHFLTPTARYADIVLPATTFWERNDVHTPWAGAGHYAIFMQQAIAADVRVPQRHRHLRRPGRAALGIAGYNDKTEEAVAARADAGTPIDDFEAFREQGRRPASPPPEDAVAFAARDPRPRAPSRSRRRRARSRSTRWRSPPSPTPTGSAPIPPIPTWIPSRSSRRALPARAGARPKSRARTHSIHDNQPILARADRDDVWIHPDDAARARHRRRRSACACSTTAAPPCCRRASPTASRRGVVSIKEGAWFTPDADGHGHAAAAPTC